MKRVRRLLEEHTPDVATGSGSLAVLALLLFVGAATCFAMPGDDKRDRPAKAAQQHDNSDQQRHARKHTRANKKANRTSEDLAAGIAKGLRKDLVVHYAFDDDDTIVYDESGNENNGVTVGDVKYEPSPQGRAARFTSNRTYVLSDAPGLNMHGWSQVSVSMWINTKRYTTYGRLISRGQVSGDGLSGIAMQAGSGSSKASFSIGRQFQNGPAIWEKLYSSSLEPRSIDRINKWVHVVGTFDGDRLRFYVNGKLDREVEAGGHSLKLWDRPEHKLVIGNSSMKSRMAWGDKYFDGLIDEVKIWRRNLSAKEIKYVYGKGQRSISSRRSGDLSQHSSPLLPESGIGVGQQTTGLDLSDDSEIIETLLNESFPELKKPEQVGVISIDEERQLVKLNAGKRDGVRKYDPYNISFRYEKPRLKAYGRREFVQVRRTLKVTEVHETTSLAKEVRRPLSTMDWPPPETTVGLSSLLGRVAVKQGVAVDVEANEVPKVIELGKDAIRFEGHDTDKVEPGLVGADDTTGESEEENQDNELDSSPGRLSGAERDILENYHTSSTMVQCAARICLRRQLTKAEVLKYVSDTMRREVKEDSITFFFAPSQLWTLTFDAKGKALSADITGKKLSRADIEGPERADPGYPPGLLPGASTKANRVIINTQTSLIDSVDCGFQDEAWAYPTGLLPNEFPELTYVSGPTDKSLSPKAAWRKPIVLKHEDSGVVLHVNCYRRRDKPAAKVVKGVVGSPFAKLREPDYQYEPLEFHDLRAATAAAEGRDVIVFRSGDVLYKVEARRGDAEGRKRVAADAAETIWQSQQTQ